MTKKLSARDRFAAAATKARATWNVERADSSASLHLYGAIGGFWGGIDPAELVPAIRDLDVSTLNVYVNSPGGDVYDGIAIRNALRQHPARVIVTVDGLAASAASFIACAGDEVVMAENAEVMIHDAWNIAIGNADELRDAAGELDRISENIAAMYAAKAGGDPADWRALMKAETWYSASEAVEAGLADRLDSDTAEPEPASNLFDLSMYAHAGRSAASAPIPAAALATNRKESTVNRAQLAAALAAGTITQEQHDAALAALVATENRPDNIVTNPVAPLAPAAADRAAVQDGPRHEPAPAVEVTPRSVNLAGVAQRIANGVRQGEFKYTEQIALALGEFLPEQDAGEAWTRPEWLGELRTLARTNRPWIDAIGTPLPLTALKAEGWRWGTEPDVDEYSLDEMDDVPGNNPTTAGDDFEAFGVASAIRVKRSVVDFGDPQFTVDFLTARMRRYNVKSNIGIRTRMLAAATNGANVTAGGVVAVLKQLVKDVRTVGGHLNRVFLDDTLYEELEDLDIGPTATLPLWLRQATIGLNLAEATADVAGLVISNDSALPAGQAAGFDNSIVDVRESPVIEPTAIAVSVGAIDFGLFGYLRLDDHDPRGIVKRKYVAAPAG